MKNIISSILNWFFSHFKIQEKIVFETGRGLIDGNPKAVYEYLIENYPDYFKTIWIVEKGTDVSSLRKKDYVFYRSLKSYYHQATAKYWIRSQSLDSLIKKRQGQIYLQLWHGNGAMKHMEYDTKGAKERPPLEHVKPWDYYIANDKLDADHIISATGYNNKIEILGMASFDITLKLSKDENFKKELLKKLGIIDFSKKIILYAPTFRDFDLNKDVIDIPIKSLEQLSEYIVLVRLHPLVRTKINQSIFRNNLINACDYPDASDLLAISDILITDYSSIFYQFSPLNRPIVFYPYDFDEYKKLRGGFYLDYEKDLPGPICYFEDELITTLKNIDNDEYKLKQRKFNEKYNYMNDGNASKRIVAKLINKEFE